MFMFLYFYIFMFLLLLSFFLFFFVLMILSMDLILFIEWEMISLKSSMIVITFLFDWMSLLFMSFVLLISSLVIFYSKEYMSEDKNGNRFIYLVVLFVFSMMLMILSPNLISILLGWDGLGLVSYCLVIYFHNIKSYNAGMVTALSNRLGDVAFLISISWMLNFGSWNFYFYLNLFQNNLIMFFIMLMILLAAMTKSAQIPFSSWLPAAMAAPTPVSALVHSSTLVTAGIYLLIRFNNLLMTFNFNYFLLILSSLTMLMSGLGANYEMDLKKIIALSTLSQLGLMMGILCLGMSKMGFFHLLSHALFKALLFLCAGVFIHNMVNFQDIRWFGGFFKFKILTCMCFNVSSLALCGMPFLSGFYSKDLILEMIYMSNMNLLILFLFLISTGLTVSYSFRLIYFSLISYLMGFSLINMNDNSWLMMKMMIILSIFSIFGGSFLMWLIFPFQEMILLSIFIKLLTIIICVLGMLLGFFIFSVFKFYFLNYNLFYYLFKMKFSFMWFMPLIFSLNFNYYFLNKGQMYLKNFDFGWNELFGGYYLYNFMKFNSIFLHNFQNNKLVMFMLISLFFFISFLFFLIF